MSEVEVSGDHKRKREASKEEEEEEEEKLDADNEQEGEEEMVLDSPYSTPNSPYSIPSLEDRSLIEDILTQRFIHILSGKVESDVHLKTLVEEIFQSLKNEQVSAIVSGVRELFGSPIFVQACVETYKEDAHIIIELEPDRPHSNAEGEARMEALKRDALFQSILQETQTTAIIRGLLSVVIGYWSDKDCYNKLSEAITAELLRIHKPNNEGPLQMVVDDIPDIDVTPDIEGLKKALAIRYENDPNRDYKHVCEEVERKKSYFEGRLASVFPGMIPKRMTRLQFIWFGKSLELWGYEYMVEWVDLEP